MQSTFDIIHPACVLTSWLLGVCVVRTTQQMDGEAVKHGQQVRLQAPKLNRNHTPQFEVLVD